MTLMQIGDYVYPAQSSFSETLAITNEAIQKYHGLMPSMKVAERLGYKVRSPAGISGPIYRRFDEMVLFGLFIRERGGIRVTELGKAALDPYDQTSANRARATAIRKISIIDKVFTTTGGKLPDEEGMQSLLKDLTGVDWKTAKDNVPALLKLFSECFPYLSGATHNGVESAETVSQNTFRSPLIADMPPPSSGLQSDIYGELKTRIGSVVIRNRATIKLAHSLLDVLDADITTPAPEQSKQNTIKESEANVGEAVP